MTATLSTVWTVSPARVRLPRGARRASSAAAARPSLSGGVRRRATSAAPRRPASASAEAPSLASPSPAPKALSFDFLVLGSGIAGLTYALKVADYGTVAVVTKAAADEGCTAYAQGGVCAVLDAHDSVEDHARDTMVAGAFLNDPRAVETVCREGPGRVLELVRLGAAFTRTASGDLHLTREGGHSARRIVHAADATGAEIERALLAACRAHPNIAFFERHLAVDLVTGEDDDGRRCALGADVLDPGAMTMTRFVAPVTMLATGGAGQVYPHTTNPSVATGDGMAMAFRARAAVANLEFVQFHPTALYAPACPRPHGPTGRSFLISEAVRGEGGVLLNLSGERFMSRVDPRAELAPRDVVARAINEEMRVRGESHVLLDISRARSASWIKEHFPTITAHCELVGLDLTSGSIPVVPAQHYMCGGVQAGLDGETTVAGLYACGEVACSGLHGANRLASNSLLEGLVFAARAVAPSAARAELAARGGGAAALRAAAEAADFSGARAPRNLTPVAASRVSAMRQELRELVWRGAGIVRRQVDMRASLRGIAELYVEAVNLPDTLGVGPEVVELRNLAAIAELVVSSALRRRESRGGHYVADFPEPIPAACCPTVIGGGRAYRRNKESSASSGMSFSTLIPPASPKRGAGRGRELVPLARPMAEE